MYEASVKRDGQSDAIASLLMQKVKKDGSFIWKDDVDWQDFITSKGSSVAGGRCCPFRFLNANRVQTRIGK